MKQSQLLQKTEKFIISEYAVIYNTNLRKECPGFFFHFKVKNI